MKILNRSMGLSIQMLTPQEGLQLLAFQFSF